MTRGRNYTTGAYRRTGIEPTNAFCKSWNENLALFAQYNGMKITNKSDFRPYIVSKRVNSGVHGFSNDQIQILKEAVPNIISRREGTVTSLDHPPALCYTLAKDVLNSWIDMDPKERPARPIASTEAEKLALEHYEISLLVKTKPKDKHSLLLDKVVW